MGAKGQDFNERLEVAERNFVTPFEGRQLEEQSFDGKKLGVSKA